MTSAAYVAALKPLLEARLGLAGVDVHLTEPDAPKAPMIVLIRSRVAHEIDWIAMGPKRTDQVTVPGRVWTVADAMQDAADQAMSICSEIGLAVKPASPSVGAQTRKAELSSIAWLPLLNDEGGWFVDAEFDITYISDLT